MTISWSPVSPAVCPALAPLARDKGAKSLRGAVATDNLASLRAALAAGLQGGQANPPAPMAADHVDGDFADPIVQIEGDKADRRRTLPDW